MSKSNVVFHIDILYFGDVMNKTNLIIEKHSCLLIKFNYSGESLMEFRDKLCKNKTNPE